MNYKEIQQQTVPFNSNFIQANTIPMTLVELKEKHIIPVFAKGVSSDMGVLSLEVFSSDEIMNSVKELFGAFEHELALQSLKKLNDVVLSQQEFEKYIGKVRLLYYNPELHQKDWLGDQQMGHVVKGYFNNSNFSSNTDGSISLWNVYNLMTEANKSSYIDRFIPKSMQIRNMIEFV
jgi:hypothetical protein